MKPKRIRCLVFEEEKVLKLLDDCEVAEMGLRFMTADTRKSMCGIFKDEYGNLYANKMKSCKVPRKKKSAV